MKRTNLLTRMLLLCALIVGSVSAWADTETATNTGTKDTDLSGTSYTISGTYVAGSGSTKTDPMGNKGVKIRTNRPATVAGESVSNAFAFTVNSGYTITAISFCGNTNADNKASTISKIYIDGAEYAGSFETGSFVAKNATGSTAVTQLTGISATSSIVIAFSELNGTSQANIYYEITYTAPASTYTVTYDANGATSGTVPTDDSEYDEDATVTVLDNTGSLAKTDCTWGGWNTAADASGTDYAAGATFSITANTTLYAKWIPNAPSTPSFSPASGALNAGDAVTISSYLATTIYYCWTDEESAPEAGDYSSSAAVDGQLVVNAPNDANKKYLYTYGSNVTGSSSVFHNTKAFTITVDDTAPTLSSSVPAAAATGVAISGTIVLTMSEAIGSVDASKFSFGSGTVSSVAIDGEDNTKVNVAYTGLSYNTATTLTVAANGISDAAGNGNAEFTLSFTTVQEICAAPVFTTVGYGFQITCATDGATIYYTVDDDDPKNSDDKAEFTLTGNNLMTLPASGTVYAYAAKTGALASDVTSQVITIPTVGYVTGSLLATMQPDDTADDVTYTSGYSKGSYQMVNDAANKGIQMTDKMLNYPYMFKAASGKITITPPAGVTIQSVKFYGVKNSNKSTGTVTVGDGYTVTTSSNVVLPRYTYYADGTGAVSEILLTNTSLAAGDAFEFTISSQFRFYVEVYGTDAAESESITPAYTYTTFIPSHDLDFTSTDKLTAYIATSADASNVTLTSVDKVPAFTPVVIKTTETGEAIAVNVAATTDDVSSNLLQMGDGVKQIGGDGKYDYILMGGQFHKVTTASALAAGKAYLHLTAAPAAGARLNLIFDDEVVTEINTVKNEETKTRNIFNLNGQRVDLPSKGLYIVNGKKVIIK